MFSYVACGLRIHSALPLPELVASETATPESKADVTIRFGRIETVPFETNGAARHIHATAKEIYLFWRGVGLFLVRGEREIIIDPVPGVKECVLRLFILGTAFAMLLHRQRGIAVLHASAVTISNKAVAFVGAKGMGKSAMAAIFHDHGYDLLADDVFAIDMNQSCPMALPGFPYLKLWPDLLALLGHDPEAFPRLRPEVEKRGYQIASGFSSTPVPLRCIYVLRENQKSTIDALPPQEAWAELMPHWYGARFGKELLRSLGISTHFLQCASLAKNVSVCHLGKPPSLSALPEVIRLVKVHLNAIESGRN